MTVQELINKLQEIPDKDKEIRINNAWDTDHVTDIKWLVFPESYVIYHR